MLSTWREQTMFVVCLRASLGVRALHLVMCVCVFARKCVYVCVCLCVFLSVCMCNGLVAC